jgi:hypothetical protein
MEFLVDQAKSVGNSYHVTGIYEGDEPIKIGSQFLKIYKVTPKMNSEGDYELAKREFIQSIKLVVHEIKAYGHSLDELDSGMSAELSLVGEEGIILLEGNILGI